VGFFVPLMAAAWICKLACRISMRTVGLALAVVNVDRESSSAVGDITPLYVHVRAPPRD
jgi:hypothetical protein